MMKSKLIAATLAVTAAVALALPQGAGAAEVRSYSLPGGITFMGGGPGKGEFVADKPVVSHRRQFAEFGREGLVRDVPKTRYARSDAGAASDHSPESQFVEVRSATSDPMTDEETRKLAQRFGRQ